MADTEKNTAKVELNILEPRATEKTYGESFHRTYVFPVDKDMSKQEIKRRVEKEFSVSVTGVRVLNRKGKQTKYSKGKHQYPGITYRRDKKFAYVTLKEGDSIKVFEEQEDNTSAKEASDSRIEDKKADKNAGKEKKQ